MEAFRIKFLTTFENGRKVVITNKAYAATGWEAIEKARKYLTSQGHIKLTFIGWKVLNPFVSHFY